MSEPRPCEYCGEDFTPDPWHPNAKVCPKVECANGIKRHRRLSAGGAPQAPSPSPSTADAQTPDEIIRNREQASIRKRVEEDVGRTYILAEMLRENALALDPNKLPTYKPPKHKSDKDAETMVCLVSDGHPGLITPSYNLEVFHERFQRYVESIIHIRDIITDTIPIKKVVLIHLGDLVTGQGIFPNQAWKTEVHVMKQIYHEAVPDHIRMHLTMLEYFEEVESHFVPGNHGRTGKEMPQEVNFDNILAQDIWRRFEFTDRLNVDIEWDWWKYVDIYDWRFLCVHGHQIRSWLNIPFYGLTNKGMRWQGSLPGGPWQYLLHGHFHVPFDFPWNIKDRPGGFHIISNGCFPSDDDFALRELGMSSSPAQQVFGVHPKRGITWRYTLDL